ncbi:fumarylacetoacetate hydrolase family protein [Spirochaeta thermophila]|uniref:Fumarylacetoacetate hydrolase domain-containing protein 2A n=1 Tax=Winmispira thermophila (strain ATCC 49972 / DSM 6192 / RI 19.B1) TaxID=665571 RepID=E0RSA3_WINT6|nr:fumarylacetoacetate hydrolase family protein [Spirochaeta thermophila]ADN01890.1 fumarylacetoacetate hydrolase domain-containing protein 2A [Spirochaeta thermophila DSM 6192]
MRKVVLPVAGTDETYTLRPSKIIALGLNYREHIAENITAEIVRSQELPEEPILFNKTPNVLIGPEDAIVLPAMAARYATPEDPERTDYEAELAVIIGRECRNISPEEAPGVIFGYTCFNDVSQRNIQKRDKSGWWRGKSFDTFGPIGPVIVPAREIPDPHALRIRCRLNGRVVQDGSTGDMIFRIPEIISFISRHMTLEEGDIIATGTPQGVGPLHPGDVVEVEIEGIGVLRNPVVAETP